MLRTLLPSLDSPKPVDFRPISVGQSSGVDYFDLFIGHVYFPFALSQACGGVLPRSPPLNSAARRKRSPPRSFYLFSVRKGQPACHY
jgi:hypothetical protein